MALKVQLLVPEMQCFRGYSQVHCMQAIRNGYVKKIFIQILNFSELCK